MISLVLSCFCEQFNFDRNNIVAFNKKQKTHKRYSLCKFIRNLYDLNRALFTDYSKDDLYETLCVSLLFVKICL